MSIIAGSYEKFIWGFDIKRLKQSTQTLTPLFTYPSHASHINTVTLSRHIAASGSADNTIKIYDLSNSSEIGSFINHAASVTAMDFYTKNSVARNLVSGAADGEVCIFDCDPFVHLKTVKVHKKGVNDLTVHPSGRLALSVGRDGCLAILNLVRARRSFYCGLGNEASIVRYDKSGDKFFMCMEEKVSVHEAEDAKLVLEFDNQKRVLCAATSTNGLLFTGGEDRAIKAWDTTSGKIAYSLEDAHSARIKGLVVLSDTDETEPFLVASASSDGVIRMWDLRMANKEKPNPLAEACTKARLTCLAGTSLKSFQRPKLGNGVTNGTQNTESEKS